MSIAAKDGTGADITLASAATAAGEVPVSTPGDPATGLPFKASSEAAQTTGNASLASIDGKLPAMHEGLLPVVPSNITGKFRDAFEVYAPNGGGSWLEAKHASDVVAVDGNAVAASYLVVSKSPLAAGTETAIETVLNFSMPVEVAFGVSMSQRTLGQEFAIELVDTGTPLADVPDIAISAISQATTTLTVDTTAPHGLSVGKSIGIRDCSDPRANYPALVVASVPTPNQFTCTAGPGGTIASQTIANPAGAKGSVYFRERLGRAENGMSQIFENATVTNSSLYIRSESGDALPSGTVAGSHAVTVGTTASVQLVNSARTYAFAPTTEFRFLAQADRTQWVDSPVDSTAQASSRSLRTQVCPDPSATYKLRIRATNNKSLTVPVAQIVSATKSGSTTATIVTDVPHGLANADPVVVYGIRAQGATEFPNLLTATAVASVVNTTTFTIVIGTSGTVTSYGGFVAKVQGGNLMSALGASAVIAQSATLTTLTDGTRQLVLAGNTNWTALSIGDGVQLVGVRNNTNGATLGVDGAWKVANAATTSLTLVPMAGNSPPADFALTNCGGGVIKRTELRVSFVRVFDFERQRVEMLARPSGDAAAAAPVTVQNNLTFATNTPTLAAGTNRAGFIAGAGIWYDDSSTVLAANATFTGTSRDATVTATATAFANAATYAEEVRLSAESDQAGTLWLEVSRDNTNWRRAKSVPTAAVTGGGQYAEIVHAPSWRYWRAGFTNGATLQTRFAIGSLTTAA